MMYCSLPNRLTATAVLCGLLFQGCRSGMHAIIEEPVVRQEHPTEADRVRGAGGILLPGSLALTSLRTLDERVSDRLDGVSSVEPAAPLRVAVVPALAAVSLPSVDRAGIDSFSQSFAGPFTTFSGVRVLLSQQPQQVQSLAEAWMPGPTMILGSDATSKETYQIPPGYRYKGYRLTPDSVIQRARLTICYVAANNEGAYRRLEATQDAHTVARERGANVGQVVILDTLESGVSHSAFTRHEGPDLKRAKHAGLVLYGSTKRNRMCRPKSMMHIQVEILLEKVEEDSPIRHGERIPAMAFGAQAWRQYFGEVGAQPCLPSDIGDILNSACPFWPGKRVKDTHLLVLIPSTVDGKAFTLDLLGELVENPRGGGHSTQYFLYDDEVQQSSGDVYSSSSYWVLLTRDVLPGSRSNPYADQQTLIATQTSHTDGPPYETPHVLEAATAILSHYVRSGDRLYEGGSDELLSTSTRCAELLEDVAGHSLPVTVGRFCSRGLVFLGGFDDDAESGVSCLRKFGIRDYRSSALLHSFGAEEWSRYFGEVEPAPPLPAHIVDMLNGACPFWPKKQVKDTHLLVLIPATVAGEPFSFNLLGELIKRPMGGGYPTRYRVYAGDIQEQFGAQSPVRSYWVLMTRDVLEGSRNQGYVSQKALVAHHANRTGLPYELPGALEAATAILSHYVRSGERLYTNNPLTYTRCQELVAWDFGNCPAAVGSFSSGGVSVRFVSSDGDLHGIGVAGLQKL